MMKMDRRFCPFAVLDLSKYRDSFINDLGRTFSTQDFVDGHFVGLLERDLSALFNRPVVGVASGTTGLIIALDAVLRPGQEVLVPALTFVATIQSIIHAGGIPRYVDVCDGSWTMDPVDAESKLSNRTGAILPVNLFGVPADTESFRALSERYSIPVIYDSCQAFGARIGGSMVGCFGEMEVFSLDALKIITGGQGGFITCASDELHRSLRQIKNFGQDSNRIPNHLGLNGRLTEFAAILARRSLKDFESKLASLQRLQQEYRDSLAGIPGVQFQSCPDTFVSSPQYHAISVRLNGPTTLDDLRNDLLAVGIETRAYFNRPFNKSLPFSQTAQNLPVTEVLQKSILCLPMHQDVSREHLGVIREILESRCN